MEPKLDWARYQNKYFVNNEWKESSTADTFPTINPATESVLPCDISQSSIQDIDYTVQTAQQSTAWRETLPQNKRFTLLKFARLIKEHQDTLTYVESIDSGKPATNIKAYDLVQAVQTLEYFAGWVDKIHGKTIPSFFSTHAVSTIVEPIGVVGVIIPWNFPLMLLMWKLAPALACGNNVILKPSEETTLSALVLMDIVVEAGFPPGTVQLVPGNGKVGRMLAQHMSIDMITFTGSDHVGKLVMQAAGASNMKKVAMELGGKSANIIGQDADLDAAVDGAISAGFVNMGENCIAGSRCLVHQSIAQEFLEKLQVKIKNMKIGDPRDSATEFGSLVSEKHFHRVSSMVDRARDQGARVLCGGSRYGTKGWFFPPTVLTDVDSSMDIWKEEVFGPVMSVTTFESWADAVRLANDSKFALAAAVWTKDLTTSNKIVRQLNAGMVWQNGYNLVAINAAFGGFGFSGFGKDLGKECIKEFTRIKTVYSPIL